MGPPPCHASSEAGGVDLPQAQRQGAGDWPPTVLGFLFMFAAEARTAFLLDSGQFEKFSAIYPHAALDG
jgi:hypothetical protein